MNNEELTWLFYIWFGLSFALLAGWVWRTNGTKEAFASAPSKEHNLAAPDILFLALVYLVNMLVLAIIMGKEENPTWTRQNIAFGVMITEQAVLTGLGLYLAVKRFSSGRRGWGLTLSSLGPTIIRSVICFFAATGLTLATLAATQYLCQQFGLEAQKHTILQKLSQEGVPQSSQVLMIISAAIAAPIMEEVLFRGMVQNYLVRFFSRIDRKQSELANPSFTLSITPVKETTHGRWMGIFIAAMVFALSHYNWQHMPALVVLGTCMGYAYERYGNLVIPILVHSLFNILPLVLTLLEVEG